MASPMPRQPEPEVMDIEVEVRVYAETDFAEVNQAFVDRLFELTGPRAEARALDLGTGPADIPVRIVRARPAWQIVAVEASAAMLRIAGPVVEEAGMSRSIHLVHADAKTTGLATGSFDVVFSNSTLHHITEADRFWAEVRRLARPGAVIFLRDLARPASPEAARRIVEQYVPGDDEVMRREYHQSLLSSYTPDEVRDQLRHAGLDTLHVAMATDRHLDVFGELP